MNHDLPKVKHSGLPLYESIVSDWKILIQFPRPIRLACSTSNSTCDCVHVYDGPDTASPLLKSYCGSYERKYGLFKEDNAGQTRNPPLRMMITAYIHYPTIVRYNYYIYGLRSHISYPHGYKSKLRNVGNCFI